jgi:hypothetical protein
LRLGEDQQPDGGGCVMPWFDGFVFGCQFSEKGIETGGGRWWIAKSLAEEDVESDPLLIVWLAGSRTLPLLPAAAWRLSLDCRPGTTWQTAQLVEPAFGTSILARGTFFIVSACLFSDCLRMPVKNSG